MKTVVKIERVGELYGVDQLQVECEEPGLYAVTLGYGSENGDFYLQMTTEQLAELRDALDRELFVDDMEAALGGTSPKLIDERLKRGE